MPETSLNYILLLDKLPGQAILCKDFILKAVLKRNTVSKICLQ